MRQSVRLAAQQLQPMCCRQNLGSKIDTTFPEVIIRLNISRSLAITLLSLAIFLGEFGYSFF